MASHDAPAQPYRSHPASHDEHGLAHITPVRMLVTILAILLVLTVITVAVTRIDLGGQWNLVVAIVIATIKASLVVAYFMHLRWDRTFNLLVLLSGVAFLILFLGLSLADRKEYQPSIDMLEQSQP
jgi:cytochrome c oxidase subunit IV